MPVVTEAPLRDLGLKPRAYKHLRSLGVETLGDLVNVPETVLNLYHIELMEAIERVRRDHGPPRQD